MQLLTYNKTRIAPTPSGFLHLGNVLSFAITIALAKRTGAKILLRIDDLDQARVNKQYLQDIFDTLNFLEICWDEGPKDMQDFDANYSQINRMEKYDTALQQLQNSGLIFACKCSRQQINSGVACTCYEKNISLTADNVNWRLFTDFNYKVNIKSITGKIQEATLPTDMMNFIVRKKDGSPAYQLTSVIDDLFYGVDLVVRGQDLWPSTIAQLILADKLGKGNIFGENAFYYHPLIMETFGKKLSKSAGATSIKHLRESGKSAAEIYRILATITNIEAPANNWEQLADSLINKSIA